MGRPGQRRPDPSVGDQLPDGRGGAPVEAPQLILALRVPAPGAVYRLLQQRGAQHRFEMPPVQNRAGTVGLIDVGEPVELVPDVGDGHGVRIALGAPSRDRGFPQQSSWWTPT